MVAMICRRRSGLTVPRRCVKSSRSNAAGVRPAAARQPGREGVSLGIGAEGALRFGRRKGFERKCLGQLLAQFRRAESPALRHGGGKRKPRRSRGFPHLAKEVLGDG